MVGVQPLVCNKEIRNQIPIIKETTYNLLVNQKPLPEYNVPVCSTVVALLLPPVASVAGPTDVAYVPRLRPP